MYNNEYQNYLNVLRTRKAQPPFAEMASLVAAAPARSPVAFPLFAKFAGALLLCGVLAAGAWMLSAKYPAVEMPRASNAVKMGSSFLSQESRGTYRSDVSYGTHSPKFVYAKNNSSQFANFAEPKASVQHDQQGSSVPHPANNDDPIMPLQPCTIRVQTASIQPIAGNSRPIPPIAIPVSEQASTGSFFSTLGSAVSQQFSSNAAFRQNSFTDAFIGVGYVISQHASLRVLVGEDVFMAPSKTTTNSIVFHDTIINSFQNVIGEIQSVNTPALTRAFWLGGSYRFTAGDVSNVFRPFAEIMAGGSSDGFLTHQSLGAEFIATNDIDFDLLLEASELLPQYSGWLTKAGFSAAMTYHW